MSSAGTPREGGLFRLAYERRDSSLVEPPDRELLAETLLWFDKNLDQPIRFNRSRSKGFYRRNTRGIAWFKDTASEHLARMPERARSTAGVRGSRSSPAS